MIDWSSFKPEVGKLLLSQPFLADPNFARTVVLVVSHDDEGSAGFVLNRKLAVSLDDLGDEAFNQQALFEGGPVQLDTVHWLHRFPNVTEAIELKPGLYWGGEIEQIKLLLAEEENKDKIKFFLGYSGWGSRQLEEEIKMHTWAVADSNIEDIFAQDTSKLWEKTMKSLGGDFAGLTNYPMDPSWN